MIKLVLTDLDDTLIPAGSDGASKRAIQAIHALLDRGIHFGPVSGRTPQAMGWMFGGDEACYATGAFVNGQVVRLDGETIHVEALDTGALERLRQYLDEGCFGAVLTLHDALDDGTAVLATSVPGQTDSLRQGTDSYKATVVQVPDRQWIKSNIVCSCDRSHMVFLRDQLLHRFPEFDFVFPSAWAPYIDILPAGYSKGSAVRILADRLGISLDEVATFGDSENDMAMLEGFPNSVSVANATEETSAVARWHIGPCSNDAVAQAFEEIAAATDEGSLPGFMS